MSLPGETSRPASGRKEGGLSEFVHSWRYFFWVLGLVLVVVLLFAEENWRGQRAWNRYQRAMAARGEPLELSAFVPPKIPDDKNFTMTPFLADLFDFPRGASPRTSPLNGIGLFASNYDAAASEMKKANAASSNSWIRARTDLPAWYAAFLASANKHRKSSSELTITNVSVHDAATGVLAQLSEAGSILEELMAASKLPGCRFNVHYEDEDPAAIMLPHLAVVKRLTQVLALRACAELALGQTDVAFEDTRLLLYLTDACKDEPFLISQVVRMEQLRLALQPVAEGMNQWSEPQLRALKARLTREDFCADAIRALKAERAWSGGCIDLVRRSPSRLNMYGGGGFELDTALLSIAPRGWFDLEKLNCCLTLDEYLLPTIDLTARQISPRLLHNAEGPMERLSQRSFSGLCIHHTVFSSLLLPAEARVARKTAFAQTAVDCAMIACALESYRRAHGQFPVSLDELRPQSIEKLPRDIINGEPLKYHRTEPGHYILYSVGWNEKDDGGAVCVVKSVEENTLSQGDWVWQLP
jgi:hypothetical protein